MNRKKTKAVFLGPLQVGGGAPVSVQSMTCTDTRDIQATIAQIKRLEEAGCELIRVAVPDQEAAQAIRAIKKKIRIPLVADIHFNQSLALASIESGAQGIRINPGNMPRGKIRAIVKAAKENGVVIRIGINSGSVEKDLLEKYGSPTADALVESALRQVALMEDMGFYAIKLSLKSSDVAAMIEACRMISEKTDYPLHLGVTEAGTLVNAAVKSAIGIGALLYEGIGDTIRVSVTGDPISEVALAYNILRALGLRKIGPDIIACPTCGRCEIDLFRLAQDVERRLAGVKSYIKIALMGCVVNGPGEAAEADVGIAGGKGFGLLFKKGQVVKKIKEKDFIDVLLQEIESMIPEKISK
ncbi:MAG: flavodoxin-dependent (E)-4-hydroxy-3-methylbut-2-enyl-diphosphate synthase [Deltaproteobacteria bacterium]|nr:flavodoxin-dependent (E)-4-hydroxy-3-methylbut-2-enyl-diphosphate synthase [Deltaproteobacteria bacterium]